MRGGKPGYMPTFKANVHPCPFNLYDPFNLSTKMTEEKKTPSGIHATPAAA